MDRRALLSELKRLVFMNDLKADDIRLYILLLTNCIGSRNGAIDYGTIKNAIGRASVRTPRNRLKTSSVEPVPATFR